MTVSMPVKRHRGQDNNFIKLSVNDVDSMRETWMILMCTACALLEEIEHLELAQ